MLMSARKVIFVHEMAGNGIDLHAVLLMKVYIFIKLSKIGNFVSMILPKRLWQAFEEFYQE